MVFGNSIISQTVRRFLILVIKKCRIYTDFGVSQSPKANSNKKEKDPVMSIQTIFQSSHNNYGTRKIKIDLDNKRMIISHRRIRRIMKQE